MEHVSSHGSCPTAVPLLRTVEIAVRELILSIAVCQGVAGGIVSFFACYVSYMHRDSENDMDALRRRNAELELANAKLQQALEMSEEAQRQAEDDLDREKERSKELQAALDLLSTQHGYGMKNFVRKSCAVQAREFWY
jgi:hypothetical protein